MNLRNALKLIVLPYLMGLGMTLMLAFLVLGLPETKAPSHRRTAATTHKRSEFVTARMATKPAPSVLDQLDEQSRQAAYDDQPAIILAAWKSVGTEP